MVDFSGFVVTFNDDKYLSECLESLLFCAHILVVDLGSTDNSIEIAKHYKANVVRYSKVLIVEKVYADFIEQIENDWIIFLDPDEVLPVGIEEKLIDVISQNKNVGAIKIPWQFYFRRMPLRTTRWGQYNNSKLVVCHRDRVNFQAQVHRGKNILEGFEIVNLPRTSFDDCIKHYWVDSYQELFEKHKRYLIYEGESRFQAGEKFSWGNMLGSVAKGTYISLIRCRGLFGGATGIFLSLFWGWYIWMGWLSLREFERELGK